MPVVPRGKCVEKTAILRDTEGRILEVDKLIENIFRGVSHS